MISCLVFRGSLQYPFPDEYFIADSNIFIYLPLTLLLIPVIYRSYKKHQVTV